MKLYNVKYKVWNNSFSGLNEHEKLSVGKNKKEAIDRVKEIVDKDARNFDAEEISSIFGYRISFDNYSTQKFNDASLNRIENKNENDCQIIAEVDKEDNSIDVAVKVDEEPLVTLNISTDGDDITIRKWIGFGDSVDECINIKDLDDLHQDKGITLQ